MVFFANLHFLHCENFVKTRILRCIFVCTFPLLLLSNPRQFLEQKFPSALKKNSFAARDYLGGWHWGRSNVSDYVDRQTSPGATCEPGFASPPLQRLSVKYSLWKRQVMIFFCDVNVVSLHIEWRWVASWHGRFRICLLNISCI